MRLTDWQPEVDRSIQAMPVCSELALLFLVLHLLLALLQGLDDDVTGAAFVASLQGPGRPYVLCCDHLPPPGGAEAALRSLMNGLCDNVAVELLTLEVVDRSLL